MRRSADGELQLLGGAVGVRGLQVLVGDEDPVTPTAQIHHCAGALHGGQTGRCLVNPLYLNTADMVGGHRKEVELCLYL